MGDRGPKPKGGYGEKREVLSTRITASTREALKQASEESGLSISSEVERRLRRSFAGEEKIVELFGGPQMYALLRLISSSMNITGPSAYRIQHDDPDASPPEMAWMSNPFAYDQAVKSTVRVLDSLRPPGDPNDFLTSLAAENDISEDSRRKLQLIGTFGVWSPIPMLHEVADAESVEPEVSDDTNDAQKVAQRISESLGPMLEYLRAADLTPEQTDTVSPVQRKLESARRRPRRNKKHDR